ncbi:L,D-transpeptidase family protein [Roseovarius sp. D22-M7]|uniref:L,D-transpeptidase family protein n=1 Tax=Roseovarius sp. D22-M7 TaxID=3127116 RepID=UPI0030100D0B
MTMQNFRFVLGALAAVALIVGLAAKTDAAPAQGQGAAFRQAVAEAASQDRDIADYYRDTEYRPIWTGEGDVDHARRQALVKALSHAARHGLPEARYDLEGLMTRMSQVRSLRDLGEVEVALTRAYLDYARDIGSGVLVPGRVDSGIKRRVTQRPAAEHLDALRTGAPHRVLRSLPPQTNEYARLMKEKLRLERLIVAGGWGHVVPAQTIKPGDRGAAVIALRDRLSAMGYLGRSASGVYDDRLQEAVRAFQRGHGLSTDGIAGPATIGALNRPARARLESVIVAMERERWLPRDRGRRHILVNLADFSARILDDDTVTFRTRAVIGKNSSGRRSPEFSDEMDHMVINPTWHVPRSITVKEYLPKLQRNPNAVSHLKLYTRDGREVNRAVVDFTAYNAGNFPLVMKQPPSTRNALGLVKFMFPNKYNIYLHDTPEKALFGRETRAFSHGCIRLQDPFEFAYELLSRQEADPRDFFHSVLNTGRESYVRLDDPVPVHIVYRTAVTQARGATEYRDDVYGRDARIWDALKRAGVSRDQVRS